MKPTSKVDITAMRKNILGRRYVTLRNQEVAALLDTIDRLEREATAGRKLASAVAIAHQHGRLDWMNNDLKRYDKAVQSEHD